MLSLFGSYQIRNFATLGGNVGTASPIGDTLPVLIALNAEVVLQSVVGTRVILIDHFFTGYRKTARLADELIVAVRIPKPRPHDLVRSYKISRRRDVDISSVSAGFSLTLGKRREVEAITLAYGGMAERVKRADKTEQFLTGRVWERATVEEAVKILGGEFDPISDVRGSARMRSVAARNLLLRFWMETAGEQ
jgi:xanthine dehydrogenase iron-sulfur cluster and FAD-binding subunit A